MMGSILCTRRSVYSVGRAVPGPRPGLAQNTRHRILIHHYANVGCTRVHVRASANDYIGAKFQTSHLAGRSVCVLHIPLDARQTVIAKRHSSHPCLE